MAISRVLLQQETFFLSAHSLLYQQSLIYDQRDENVGKFNKRIIFNAQMVTLQNMCPFYCSVWILALVFQRCISLSASQKLKKIQRKAAL